MTVARWNGRVIATSVDTIIVEGNHYFPESSIDTALFEDSATHSNCPWKGIASYKTLVVDNKRNTDAVWFYPDPLPAAAEIKGYYAFWKGVEVA